ncbi:hypothetical protein ARMGADRAFT_942251, partial [Armillaria gallica]
SALPIDGKLICYIIYTDKTHLSSFETVQGYPVIVRLGNLPAHIHNRQGVGGGRVISWLPIVSDEPKHHSKSYYADLKRAIWHKAFEIILSSINNKSNTGAWMQPPRPDSDAAPWHIFSTIMILSADYEEQCIMSLIRGSSSGFSCNICVVYKDKQDEMNEEYRLQTSVWSQELYNETTKLSSASITHKSIQNVFWSIEHYNIHQALSFDCLHAFHNGLFGDHLHKELMICTSNKYLASFTQLIPKTRLANFSSWKDLYHFKQGFINVMFTDGRKYEALKKQLIFIAHNILTSKSDPIGYILLQALQVYMELDMYARLSLHTSSIFQARQTKQSIFITLIEEYEVAKQAALEADKASLKKLPKNWDFPKIHLLKHLFDDIEAKGVTFNYNTKPNESMHGSFKELYQ